MASYEIRMKRSAVKELRAIGASKDRRAIVRRIAGLAEDPRPPGCQKLAGQEGHRIRSGSYRVIYTIDDTDRVVVVFKIGHRGDVYR